MNCRECQQLSSEHWPHDVTAFRCMADAPHPFGNGRVVGNPSKFIPARIDAPAWCPKRNDKGAATR